MANLAFATLKQLKLATGRGLLIVQESLVEAGGLLTRPFFITLPNTGRVATYGEVTNTTMPNVNCYAPNPLSYFSRGLSFLTGFTSSLANAQLKIYNPPELWSGASPAYTIFTVDHVDPGDGRLVMQQPFWTAETGLTWELSYFGSPAIVANGITGATQRKSPGLTACLDSQLLTTFETLNDALTHLNYTKTELARLTADINNAGTLFTGSPNPIYSMY